MCAFFELTNLKSIFHRIEQFKAVQFFRRPYQPNPKLKPTRNNLTPRNISILKNYTSITKIVRPACCTGLFGVVDFLESILDGIHPTAVHEGR